METKMQQIIEDIAKKINAEKERLLFERIKERVVENGMVFEYLNLQEETKRRFPRIMCEHHEDQSLHYYWNDGTKNGLHLISFYQTPLETMMTGDNFKSVTGFTYK